MVRTVVKTDRPDRVGDRRRQLVDGVGGVVIDGDQFDFGADQHVETFEVGAVLVEQRPAPVIAHHVRSDPARLGRLGRLGQIRGSGRHPVVPLFGNGSRTIGSRAVLGHAGLGLVGSLGPTGGEQQSERQFGGRRRGVGAPGVAHQDPPGGTGIEIQGPGARAGQRDHLQLRKPIDQLLRKGRALAHGDHDFESCQCLRGVRRTVEWPVEEHHLGLPRQRRPVGAVARYGLPVVQYRDSGHANSGGASMRRLMSSVYAVVAGRHSSKDRELNKSRTVGRSARVPAPFGPAKPAISVCPAMTEGASSGLPASRPEFPR